MKSSGGVHRGVPVKKGLDNLSCCGTTSNININANNNYYHNKKKESSNDNSNNNTATNQFSIQETARRVFSEKVLDDKGYLNQYVHLTSDEYYIRFENGTSRALQMKLILEGLYKVNNPNLEKVPFISNLRSRKLFYLKVRPEIFHLCLIKLN